MGSEKYKLKWSKYESNILSAFHGLLESENLSDVTLFCEGQTFKAHRLVLAACSTHFENLFNHTPVNAPLHSQFFVILDGTRADDLQILLHFMYRGEAYLHQDRINSVLRTAEVLQVKGLSEGPRNIEINQNQQQQQHGSNSRSWSPPMVNAGASSPRHKKAKPSDAMERDVSPILGRRLSGSPMHSGSGRMSPSYGYPPATREPFPMFSGSRNLSSSYNRGGGSGGGGISSTHSPGYSPPIHRSKSPPLPPHPRSAGYASSSSSAKFLPPSPPPHPSSSEPSGMKEDVGPPGGGSRSAQATPISNASPSAGNSTDMYEVRSNNSERPGSTKNDCHNDYEPQRRTPSSIKSAAVAAAAAAAASPSFPSDSTTSEAPGGAPGPSSILRNDIYVKDEHARIRRSSDPGVDMDENASVGSDEHPSRRGKYDDFRARDDLRAANSSPERGNEALRMSEEEIRNQVTATNLENFRRFAQAQAERELMPRTVLQRAAAVSAAAAGGLPSLTAGLTASDYMRFAMPVRDTSDDTISGSGTKLKCPFCERTYGYETNLRAHIRQRHQGIRVSCPYCPRTFTRNNTVRRHVQREHRHLVGRIPTKFGSTRVMPDPITAAAAAAAAAAHHHQQQQQQQHRAISPPPVSVASAAAVAAAAAAAAAAGAASGNDDPMRKSPGGHHA